MKNIVVRKRDRMKKYKLSSIPPPHTHTHTSGVGGMHAHQESVHARQQTSY